MLDYAANVVLFWPIAGIRAAFEHRCQEDGQNADQQLRELIGSEGSPDAFWQQVKTNLQAGRVRLLFVADTIPAELRRIIEFLNQQMNPAEVLAVEVKQYLGEGVRTLMPRVLGQTASLEIKKAGGQFPERRQWDKNSFFADLQQKADSGEIDAATALYRWSEDRLTRIDFGTGSRFASFIPIWERNDTWFCPFRVSTGYTAPYVTVPLGGSGMKAPPFNQGEIRSELVRRLNAIDGVRIDESISGYPSIKLSVFSDSSKLQEFLNVMDWAVSSVAKAAPL